MEHLLAGMNADTLRALVGDYFVRRAVSFDLDADRLEVEYVLNWGGFVNCSYRIRDGRHAYHLKLSSSDEDKAALRRWMELAPLLDRYHAPPILTWIDLGSASGILSPHLPGAAPPPSGQVAGELIPVLQRLHADQRLVAALQPPQKVTARADYMASFHERFTEDLRGIRETPPPFVELDLIRWLEDEVSVLAQLVASTSTFDEHLANPIHGDLWLNNILWVSRKEWHIVDWDDLRIGDPAADFAALLGPTAEDPRPLKMRDLLEDVLTPTERQRLPLLGRATLLDWVIDPLSDWIDAGCARSHEQVVRTEKERVHRRALACYEELYR